MNKVSENALEESINFAQEICKAAPIAVKTTVQALRRRQEAVGLGLEVIFTHFFREINISRKIP